MGLGRYRDSNPGAPGRSGARTESKSGSPAAGAGGMARTGSSSSSSFISQSQSSLSSPAKPLAGAGSTAKAQTARNRNRFQGNTIKIKNRAQRKTTGLLASKGSKSSILGSGMNSSSGSGSGSLGRVPRKPNMSAAAVASQARQHSLEAAAAEAIAGGRTMADTLGVNDRPTATSLAAWTGAMGGMETGVHIGGVDRNAKEYRVRGFDPAAFAATDARAVKWHIDDAGRALKALQ